MTPIVIVAVFVVTFLIIAGAYWVFVARFEEAETRAVRERLIGRRADASALVPVVKEEARLSSVTLIETLLQGSRRIAVPLQRLILQAGLSIRPGALLLSCVLAGLVAFALGTAFTSGVLMPLVAAVIVGALPLAYVRQLARRRMAKFEEQFPEAIDLLARSLRAGHALTTALQLAAEEMPEPVGAEFQLLFDRQNYGMSLPDAMREFGERIPLLDARFFVTAVLIQRETGGNLSGVLDNLANVIRERFKVKRQVRVLTAHGRITGWVLGMLPPVVGALLFLISPDLMSPMITDPIGRLMLATGFGLQVTGVLIIRRIINVEY